MEFEINGVRYASWDDVPADAREELLAAFPDEDGDGVPDRFDQPGRKVQEESVTNSVTVNGVEYDSAEDLPAELRQLMRREGLPLPGDQLSQQQLQDLRADHAEGSTNSDSEPSMLHPRASRESKWWQFWRRD